MTVNSEAIGEGAKSRHCTQHSHHYNITHMRNTEEIDCLSVTTNEQILFVF